MLPHTMSPHTLKSPEQLKDLEHRLEVMLDMWDTHSLAEIAEKLGMTRQRVSQISQRLRELGIPIPPKTGTGRFDWVTFANKNREKYIKRYGQKEATV